MLDVGAGFIRGILLSCEELQKKFVTRVSSSKRHNRCATGINQLSQVLDSVCQVYHQCSYTSIFMHVMLGNRRRLSARSQNELH